MPPSSTLYEAKNRLVQKMYEPILYNAIKDYSLIAASAAKGDLSHSSGSMVT